ncbi:hypothetical protein WICPIJ_010168 [Wickerhamomyces pijperi]|uniref:Iron-sulfur cluster biogenesis chaperone, mitochondrial n=1 Tax=Wickerhamomyces pijperi TaxID=599730 RepID=A0A9P8PH20_WICPI|nr:hypothetical protein WICPIJ_010168 [Wickerhamomyces pijperi]
MNTNVAPKVSRTAQLISRRSLSSTHFPIKEKELQDLIEEKSKELNNNELITSSKQGRSWLSWAKFCSRGIHELMDNLVIELVPNPNELFFYKRKLTTATMLRTRQYLNRSAPLALSGVRNASSLSSIKATPFRSNKKPTKPTTTKSPTSSQPLVIGIDLGTTNSAVAVMQGSIPQILSNEEDARTTPSVVAIEKSGKLLVGAPAKRQAVLNTENTFYASKRLIGRRYDEEEIKYDMSHVTYKIVPNINGDAWLEAHGKSYSPSQIGGFILNKMKEIAENSLNKEIKNAVVTVPAYFNDAQRQATKTAGELVGLNVLRVVNEPTAAALAYGLDKTKDGIVAVYDLGGGTFDISILDIEDGVFEVRATNGDTHLGGEDFDILLVRHILEDFKTKTGVDISGERDKVQRIREAAERAKIELSHVKETTIDLPFIKDTHHISMKLTEEELDAMTLHLINETIEPVKRALKDSDLDKEDIDEVILVGGMTRMPKIRSTVESLFKKKPNTSINPDEAVALGAAIQGGVLSGAIKDVLLLDVTPLTLGIETYGGLYSPLIPRNTVVPVKKTEVFSTGVDNQTGVEIRVFQGERQLVQDNQLIGNFKLSGIPALPKGVPKVEVSFDIDANGIINVSAKELTSGQETSISVVGSSGLTDSEIQRIIEEGEQFKEEDKVKKAKAQAARDIGLLVKDTENGIEVFKPLIEAEEGYPEMQKKIKEIEEAIEVAKSNGDITVQDLQRLSVELQAISMPPPLNSPRSSFNLLSKTSDRKPKQAEVIAASYLPLLNSSLTKACWAPLISMNVNSTPFSLSVDLIKSLPAGGTWLSKVPKNKTNSQFSLLNSLDLIKESSFMPLPRAWLWISVAKKQTAAETLLSNKVRQSLQVINSQLGILVIRFQWLFNLILVTQIGTWTIVSQGFRSNKVMVNRRTNNNVPVTSNLLSETSNWSSHLINLRPNNNSWESGVRIVWNVWMEGVKS